VPPPSTALWGFALLPHEDLPLRRHILVVEDEADIRELLRLTLEGAGHTVQVAPDGEAAWSLAVMDAPRLVVTDLRMPKMDGLQLIQALRSDPRCRAVPVILFTAYAATDPRVNEARTIDGVEVVTKGPIADLRAAVARALTHERNGER